MNRRNERRMIIEGIENAKIGDWIVAKYDGHLFEGGAYGNHNSKLYAGELYVGNACVRYESGKTPISIEIVSIERPMPPLPTEPGSVILDVVTDDGGTEPIAFFEVDLVFHTTDGYMIYPEEIVSFTPAKVVPA